MGQPSTRWFSQVLEDIKNRGKSWARNKKTKDYWNKDETGDFSSTNRNDER
jgi:hypothetical protein